MKQSSIIYQEHIRQSNFELLRILCMLLIVCGHTAMSNSGDLGSTTWLINNFVRGITCVAVNAFVLISGYFSINLNAKKLFRINNMVTFYSVIFLCISIYLGIHSFSPRTDWMHFLPIVTKQYWFITIYFVLCILAPFLNIYIEHISQKQFINLLLTLFVLFCILPTIGYILNFRAIVEDAGYGIVNFIFLYMLGRYIRLYYKASINCYYYLGVYLLAGISIAASNIILSHILGFKFDSLISYNTIFCLVGSVGLFLFFSTLNFKSKLINNISKYCLAVYVLHISPLFYNYLFKEIIEVPNYSGISYILLLILCPIVIFLACAIIEAFRINGIALFSKAFSK